ncbi:HEAT repeat domain-containing protein [Anabaena azotica]|uniref:HEAT repeat domain-containing protein n=1 Tax=Anabaena azotica FACHB-119 TaxID=947527 RepID=A0ABR8CZF8_9NOST|nr:HEAT repeat domain-containing protein [Anabaena azotica]MBD2499370.1 HEAT repeat domain-containing protein [Anabaena azotica FACHB-119]
MITIVRQNTKPSRYILYSLVFILSFLLCLPWVSAKEQPKPQPQAWQINGILAALDDGHDTVKGYALSKLVEYDLENLKSVSQKLEDIAKKAVQILKDKSVDNNIRYGAVDALGNLGDAAKPYVKDIADLLKDKSVHNNIRYRAAWALASLGDTAKPYIKDIADLLKDKSDNSYVRSRAVEAFGNLGDAAKPYVKDIADLLKDKSVDSNVRSGAAEALGNLGDAAKPYVKDIADILKDKSVDSYVRSRAAEALGNLGDAAKPYVKDIADILKDKSVDSYVRYAAAWALGNLGDAAKPYVKDILDFLKDESVDSYGRSRAAEALGKLGDAAKPYVKDILDFLKDESVDSYYSSFAAEALGNLGDAAKPYVKDIADILKDKSVDSYVRYAAAWALGKLGDAAKPYVKDILDFLKDESVDNFARYNAALALGNLGDAAKPYVKDILDFLKDESVDNRVRYFAAIALGKLGDAAKPYIKDIALILKDKSVDNRVRYGVAEALGKIEQLNLNNIVVILDSVYYADQSKFAQYRFLTYFLGGGTEEVKTLLTWLGFPETIPASLSHDEAKKTLEVFLKAWEASKGLERLREDLAHNISIVADSRKVPWKWQDITLLQSHYNNLKTSYPYKAYAVQSQINNLENWQWFFTVSSTILTHITFWLALIFAYPKFPQIQAIFFWNPWVRRILGVGYVGFLLTWFPPFRRKLFAPFKPSLLADAGLDNFQDKAYFPQSMVKVPGTGEILPVTAALPSITGQIILEGDSGLGKSMFLRHLLQNSQRIVVYLPAQKCHKGVIEAIQDKLHGQAQDADFLKNLIYSGAIDICIDGLNEVTAETRAKICQFVESYFRGNIIMTTQPLEWTPPSTAKTYHLQPLEQTQIQEFLLSRQPRLPQDAPIQGADYETACTNYLTQALTTQQPKEELAAARRILSNPMDLTVVALMLAQGQQPDLFRLQQQQYNLMAAEYEKEWKYEFPLKKFSAAVYEMRMQDKQALPAEEFYQAVTSLEDEKYKMVVSRQWKNDKGEDKKEWYFRHDKIMDFFLVQNFLGDSDEAEGLLVDRMGDPRFRGVYFLLATLLPLDAAKELREKLIQYAADTKDNTVSNTFVQLLRTR